VKKEQSFPEVARGWGSRRGPAAMLAQTWCPPDVHSARLHVYTPESNISSHNTEVLSNFNFSVFLCLKSPRQYFLHPCVPLKDLLGCCLQQSRRYGQLHTTHFCPVQPFRRPSACVLPNLDRLPLFSQRRHAPTFLLKSQLLLEILHIT